MKFGGNDFIYFPDTYQIGTLYVLQFTPVIRPTFCLRNWGAGPSDSPLALQPFNEKGNCRKWEAM